MRDVNETSRRAREAVKRNRDKEVEDRKSGEKTGEKALSGLALEDSISSLKTADDKIAAIIAENDAKIKSMRSQSSAEEILSYYQTQLGNVDVPGAREGSTSKTNRVATTVQKATRADASASIKANSAAAYRPLSKGTVLKQGTINSTVQLPDIRSGHHK